MKANESLIFPPQVNFSISNNVNFYPDCEYAFVKHRERHYLSGIYFSTVSWKNPLFTLAKTKIELACSIDTFSQVKYICLIKYTLASLEETQHYLSKIKFFKISESTKNLNLN